MGSRRSSALRVARRARGLFRRNRRSRLQPVSAEVAHTRISDAILACESKPYLVGRSGVTEARVLTTAFGPMARNLVQKGEAGRFPEVLARKAKFQSGISGTTSHHFLQFAFDYLAAALTVDLYAHADYVKGGRGIAEHLQKNGVPVVEIASLEPLSALRSDAVPWTRALEGKRVLVVHPFVDSIRRGYERRSAITGVRDLLPELAALEVVRPPVTFLNVADDRHWRSHFADLTAQMSAVSYDVAIVGAGGYGLPAAAFARDCGKVAIHLAGATQLLFGIRGERWIDHSEIGPWIDHTWLAPTDVERFPGHESFERGKGYW